MSDIKVTKKDIQEARKPDVVLARATSLFDWILARKTIVVGALVLLVVIVGGVSVAAAHRDAQQREIGEKLASALELSTRPVKEVKAGETKNEKSFATKEEKDKAVDAALTAVVNESPDSETGRAASLRLAHLRLDEGKTDDAIAGYEKYLAGEKDGGLRLFVTESLGYAYEKKGDLAKAGETFAKLADAGAPGRALYHKARLAEMGGKKDEAKTLYAQVVKEYENDVVASDARTRLELIDAPPPGTGAITAPPPEPEVPAKGAKKPAPKKKLGVK